MIIDKISGKTSLFGVMGDPIEHTYSPIIQNTFADKLGYDMIYSSFHVKEEGLENAIKGAYELNIKGINVTVPHKKNVMKYLYAVDEKATQIGAVNTLKYTDKGYIGYNTDITGIYYTLQEAQVSVENKKVLLIGAGGAACAMAVLALLQGCEELIIANRTVENGEKLKKHISKFYTNKISVMPITEINSIENCNIVVNTTTVGFADKIGISPIEDKKFFKEKKVEFVFDVIYTPWKTKLIEDAESEGVKAVNGFSMLVYQAVAAQEIWFEKKIPLEIKKEIKDQLAVKQQGTN